jgi:hypothetical protein
MPDTTRRMTPEEKDAANYRLQCLDIAARHGLDGAEERARGYIGLVLGTPEAKPAPDPAELDPKLKGLLVAWNAGLVALVTPDGEELILSKKMFEPGAIEAMVSLLEKERRALLGRTGR